MGAAQEKSGNNEDIAASALERIRTLCELIGELAAGPVVCGYNYRFAHASYAEAHGVLKGTLAGNDNQNARDALVRSSAAAEQAKKLNEFAAGNLVDPTRKLGEALAAAEAEAIALTAAWHTTSTMTTEVVSTAQSAIDAAKIYSEQTGLQ
ncbi:MAG TPA: hypothetical protein VMR45_01645 [Patescibacteria group bacterium]|nr:hypothetical protein [Patescibacteria group bacterium]